ncbi:MAG: hypothetical protein LBR66_04825, partial [Candidatus Symbiothrix sp.]|nr:hypothetical protein [Candidatus Symbiothrix sp.]
MKKIILILFTCLCATLAGKAQVTIGTLQDPHRGALIHLRTTTDNVPTQRVDTLGTKLPVVALPDTAHLNLGDALIYNLDVDETATGMVVYNTTNDPCGRGLIPCLYVWDGATWRPAGCSFPECAPSGSPVWEKNPYVGAFWRDNQTGERIIVGTASPTTPWKV